MTDTEPDPTFADVFPRADEARWRALATAALKGAPFESLMSTATDGFAIAPLYQRLAEDRPRPWRATAGAWRVCARVDDPDAARANAQLLRDLEGGADAIHLVFAGSVGAHGFGLAAGRAALAQTLEGVAFEARLPIEVDLSAATRDNVEALTDLIEASHVDPASCSVTFGLDPLGWRARTGDASEPWSAAAAACVDRMKGLVARGWRGRFAVADGRVIADAGGTPGQELAFLLASALTMLRALDGAGVALEQAREMIGFRLTADADQFISLAKLRALRALWARVEQSCELAPAPAHVHAETAWRVMTRRDPWVNLLRGAVATVAAGLGGADVVTVLPFTQALGLPDPFARRLARNTQLILIEELHLGRVIDPAAGSGAFEALTDALCERAWALFQEVERDGGLPASLDRGAFQARVASARVARELDVARRRIPMIGVSAFARPDEAPVAVLAPAPIEDDTPVSALSPGRDAAPYERLRDANDARAAVGGRPRVFLANLGTIATHGARAGFARALFETGGVEVFDDGGFDDDGALAAAFRVSGAALACLCGSDAVYAARAASAARALMDAGAKGVWLAGRPADDLRAAGVSSFLHAGCDVLAALQAATDL